MAWLLMLNTILKMSPVTFVTRHSKTLKVLKLKKERLAIGSPFLLTTIAIPNNTTVIAANSNTHSRKLIQTNTNYCLCGNIFHLDLLSQFR